MAASEGMRHKAKVFTFSTDSEQTQGWKSRKKREKRGKSINSDGAPQCKCDFNVALKMQRFATPKAAETMLQIIKVPANCQT